MILSPVLCFFIHISFMILFLRLIPLLLLLLLSLFLIFSYVLTRFPGSLSLHLSMHLRCRLLRVNLCRWSSGDPFGLPPPQDLLSWRSLIAIRSDCRAAQRWPMIAHPAILMLIACRLRAASNWRGSHDALQRLSLSIRAHDCSKDFLCNKDWCRFGQW